MRSRGVLDRPVKPGDDSFDCGGRLTKPQFLPRSAATKQSTLPCCSMDCFAEPVIGQRFAPTRSLAMTILSNENPLMAAGSAHCADGGFSAPDYPDAGAGRHAVVRSAPARPAPHAFG